MSEIASELIAVFAITVKNIPADVPQFRREYSCGVGDIKVKITTRSFMGNAMYSGELDQADGKWVLFDPVSPADKILDRELLPGVQKICRQVLEADRAFRAATPAEFSDESGAIWRRGVAPCPRP